MKQFLIKPKLVGDLSYANTTSSSLYGKIVSNWTRKGRTAEFKIEVPPNTTATLFIPAAAINDILEDGRPVAAAVGVKHLRAEQGCQVFTIGAGRYVFSSTSVQAAE